MDRIIEGISRFRTEVFPAQRSLYEHLALNGQKPQALVISCSDSRVVPEQITQSAPGTIFVTRNVGNVVPPYSDQADGGVTSAIEYAVVGLGVRHIVICGHTDCGAMKALLNPAALDAMPSVRRWLGHCRCSVEVFTKAHGDSRPHDEKARLLAMENVVAQLAHLRTHPSVASGIATGTLTLHGWVFDIQSGTPLVLDGETGTFSPFTGEGALPVALAGQRRAIRDGLHPVAAA